MNKKTKVDKRKQLVSKRLQKLALEKTPPNKESATNAMIGFKVGVTGQTVSNYIKGEGKDGYLIEALISEFEKLPTPEKEEATEVAK